MDLAIETTKKIPLGKIGEDTAGGLGPFGTLAGLNTPQGVMAKLTGALSGVIGFITLAAAFWFLIQFLTGGIGWMSAAGDKNKLQQARDRLSNAFVGLVIVVAGWGILALAGQFFGWSDILLPTTVLDKIRFGN